MDSGRQRGCRELELAVAYVRSSQLVDRFMPTLRKCSALINREEASGVIIQRIIGSEPRVLHGLNWVLNSLSAESVSGAGKPLSDAIDELGWPMVREIALIVLLHELHCELAPRINVRPEALDRCGLAVLSASTEVGASAIGSLFANIGEFVMAIHEEVHGTLRRQSILTSEDLVRAENDTFGFDHGALSAAMLSEVDFPSAICQEILTHPAVGTQIWTGEHLAADLGFRGFFDNGFATVNLWPKLRMSPRRIERLKASIVSATELPDLAFADMGAEAA